MSAFEAFREQIETAIATAQRERDHWARQAEKLSELLEGGEPSPPEPKASPAGEPKPTPKAVDGPKPKPKPARRPQASSVAARVEAALHGEGALTSRELREKVRASQPPVDAALRALASEGKANHDDGTPRRWTLTGRAPLPTSAADENFRGTSAQLRDALEVIEAEPEVGGEVVHRIQAALGESDVALTIHSLARATSCTSGAVVSALRRLRSDGRATELEPGRWRAASGPAAVR